MDTQQEFPRTFSDVFDQANENIRDLAAVVGSVSYAISDRAPVDQEDADRTALFYWLRRKLATLEEQLDELLKLHRPELGALEEPEPEMDQAEMEEAARGLKMAIDNAISRRAATS